VKARIAKKVARKSFFLKRMRYKISTVKAAYNKRRADGPCLELLCLAMWRTRLSKRDQAIFDALCKQGLENL
jgi:hypothetical protein